MKVSNFDACCGLKVISGFNTGGVFWGSTTPKDQLRKDLRTMLTSDPMKTNHNGRHNSSLVALNGAQKEAYTEVLKEFGFEEILQFKNRNENSQPLYLYFKDGGPISELPSVSVPAPDKTPKKPTVKT